MLDKLGARGRFITRCFDSEGQLRWSDEFNNVVTTEGKNLAFDTLFAGSAYTVVGPYMGLISNTSFSAVQATDVGTQINGTNGWKEAGGSFNPTYTGNRKTCVWAAASSGSKALSAALTFVLTSGPYQVQGVFIVLGTGAVNTKDDAHGKLWSAGVFTGGAKPSNNGDSLVVSYSTSM